GHGAEPLLAAVTRLRQRLDRHAAEPVDVVDERLVGGEAEVGVGRIRLGGEGPRARERERADRAQAPAREPAPAADDEDGVADPLDRPTLGREQERARDEEDSGDEIEHHRPVESAGGGIPGHRKRPERSRGEAEDEEVLLRSEERRVGKECRSRWSAEHEKKKKRRLGRTEKYDDEK